MFLQILLANLQNATGLESNWYKSITYHNYIHHFWLKTIFCTNNSDNDARYNQKWSLSKLLFVSTLTLVMLNKLRCHTHFQLSANQITWSRLLIQIHILNDKQCRSRTVSFFKPTCVDLHCLQRCGISRFSRTRVKVFCLKTCIKWKFVKEICWMVVA